MNDRPQSWPPPNPDRTPVTRAAGVGCAVLIFLASALVVVAVIVACLRFIV